MKQLVAWSVGFVVIVLGVWGAWWYFIDSFASGSITFNQIEGATVGLYSRANNSEKLVKQLTSGESLRIHKGTYVIKSTGDNIADINKELNVSGSFKEDVEISYSSDYLSAQLKQEQSAINTAIAAQIPELSTYYQQRPGKLYRDGSWYASRLRYIGTGSNRDTLRLIVHKEASGWKVVTTTPPIIASFVEYPDVPKSVINDVNSDDIPQTNLLEN